MPGTGLEPACLAALAPKASVSANSTIPASLLMSCCGDFLRLGQYIKARSVNEDGDQLTDCFQGLGARMADKKMDPLLTADPSQLKRSANRSELLHG